MKITVTCLKNNMVFNASICEISHGAFTKLFEDASAKLFAHSSLNINMHIYGLILNAAIDFFKFSFFLST